MIRLFASLLSRHGAHKELRRFQRDLDARLAARKQARLEGRVYVSGYVRAK